MLQRVVLRVRLTLFVKEGEEVGLLEGARAVGEGVGDCEEEGVTLPTLPVSDGLPLVLLLGLPLEDMEERGDALGDRERVPPGVRVPPPFRLAVQFHPCPWP